MTSSPVGCRWSANSTCTILRCVVRLPCLIALMTDSRTATPTQCIESSSNPMPLAQMIADQLDEVQHVEGAAELEPDDRAVGGHAS